MSEPGINPIGPNPATPPPAQEKKCAKCGKIDEKVQLCARCQLVSYCTKECQRAHWPAHKLVCVQKSSSVEEIIAPYKQNFIQWKQDPKGQETWAQFANSTVNLDQFFYNSYTTHCKGKGNKSALDLGCGTGSHSFDLLTQGWKVIALDYCTEVLKKVGTQANQMKIGKNLTLREGDINDYDFPDKHQLIVALDVLPYSNPNKLADLLKSIHGALEEGGVFIGSIFIAPHPIAKMAWFFKDSKTVKDLLTALGFKIAFLDCQPRKDYSKCQFVVRKAS